MGSNIDFAQCVCGESCKAASGLEKCYHNLRELSCPDSTTCKELDLTIVNPVDGFMLKCGDIGSCQGSNFDIVLDGTGAEVSHFDVISCSGSSSCQGATFTVENEIGLPEVLIKKNVLDMGLPCAPVMINAPPPNAPANPGLTPVVPVVPVAPINPEVQQYIPGQIQV